MKPKRLYKRESSLLLIIAFGLVMIIGISAYFIFKDNTSPFEEYYLNRDYGKLYEMIDSPDFSKDIFNAYMNYNFGFELKITGKEKEDNQINYLVKGINGIKKITLKKKKNKYLWEFNDYSKDWNFKLPENAKLYIEDLSFKSVNGTTVIERLPLSIYEIRVEKKNCESYSAKIMAGQNVEVKLKLSEYTLDSCKKKIDEYLNFKEKAINEGVIEEVTCINRDSGIYKEVVEDAGWLKGQDFKKTQKLLSLNVLNGNILEDDSIAVDVIEKWDISIAADGNSSENKEEDRERYIFKYDNNNFIIAQIKTNQ